MADIEKMFHEVLVDKNNGTVLRLIWRNIANKQFQYI